MDLGGAGALSRFSIPLTAFLSIKSIIKLLISALMLMVVLQMAKYDKLAATFRDIPIQSLLIVVVAYSMGQLLSSYKWCTIANAGGIKASYPAALRAYFIGMYLNCFGLGTVGGDVARGLLLAPGQHKKVEALASVVADRLHGLAVLSGIGAVSACIFGIKGVEPWLAYLLIATGGGIAIGWFIAPAIVLKILPSHSRFRPKVETILAAFPRKPLTILKITAISFTFHMVQISLHRVMGLAVGVEIPWSVLLVTIPFVNILGTLPISWNGVGVREKGYQFVLVPAGVQPEHAIAFGAMWLLAVTVSSAIGGIVAVATKDFSKLEEAALAETAQPTVTNES